MGIGKAFHCDSNIGLLAKDAAKAFMENITQELGETFHCLFNIQINIIFHEDEV